MKIQYASDLHLEFYDNSKFLRTHPLKPVGDILILAGDIECLNRDHYYFNSFWDYVSDNFKEVIVVVGNHEYYKGYDLAKNRSGKICSVRKNVSYYYNAHLKIDEVSFILSPLWSIIPNDQADIAARGVSDFHRIIYNGFNFTVEEFNKEHNRCISFIKREIDLINNSLQLNKSENVKRNKIVVVTHHVPSFLLSSTDFSGSKISGVFNVELSKYIESSCIDYWIYGHSHRSINKTIGNTQCISNQLGYVFYDEHHNFDNSRIIEL